MTGEPSMFSLQNKVALVTGGSRGIGAAISRRLAKAGAEVVINYKSSEEQAKKLLTEIQEFSPQSMVAGFDVSNGEEVEKGIADILQKKDKVDIVVANAGIAREALFPRSTTEHFEEVLKTNLYGSINVIRNLSRCMMKNRYGRIICISSIVGEIGNKGQSAYATSKAALFGLSKSIARELGSRHITCNVVAPGFIETEMTQGLPEEVKKTYFEGIALGRFGLAEEVAACVHFLASEEAGYITGTTIDINGGLLMR